ncbi:hypothetical protein MMC07_003893 [Pseudocyphellaria aurata]|nr:hypothetical protein [Pseudocyphellaria aurata]
MRLGLENLWRGLTLPDKTKIKKINAGKHVSKRTKFHGAGRIMSRLLGGHKKAQQVDVQCIESSSSQEPISHNTPSMTPNATKSQSIVAAVCHVEPNDSKTTVEQEISAHGTNSEILSLPDQHDDAKRHELLTANAVDVREDVKTPPSSSQEPISHNTPSTPNATKSKSIVAAVCHIEPNDSKTTMEQDISAQGTNSEILSLPDQHDDAKRNELLTANADDRREDVQTPTNTKTRAASCSVNDSQQENPRLCEYVDLPGSEIRDLKSRLQDVQTENQLLKEQLAQALESDRDMAKKLRKAYEDGEVYIQRMHHLNYALEQQPGKYADITREIELRDHKCSDLMSKWQACSDQLTEERNKWAKEKQIADANAAVTAADLIKNENEIAYLEMSKESYQRQYEDIYAMLARRIVPSDLFEFMNEYFHLVVDDNKILKAKVEEQSLEAFKDREKIRELKGLNEILEKSKLFDKQLMNARDDKIIELDNQLGGLKLEFDCVTNEQVQIIKNKDSVIANMRAEIDGYSREITILQETDERELVKRMLRKNDEIAGLRNDLDRQWLRNCELQRNENARIAEAEFTAFAVCKSEIESDQLKARFDTANEELRQLRRKLQESEIPQPGCHAATVFLQGAVDEAHAKIRELETELSNKRTQPPRHPSTEDSDVKGKGKQRQDTGEGPSGISKVDSHVS